MRRKILLLLLVSLIWLPFVNAEKLINKDDVASGTYIIGKYMFTREPNENNDYDIKYEGKLTTPMIMFGAKSITDGDDLSQMRIYYKKVDGTWIDAVTGENLNVPEEFEIYIEDFVINKYGFDMHTVEKNINGKKLTLGWSAHTSDESPRSTIDIDLYANYNKIYSYSDEVYTECVECIDFMATKNAIDQMWQFPLQINLINNDKEYFTIETEHSFLVLDDNGNVIFEKEFEFPYLSSICDKYTTGCSIESDFDDGGIYAPYVIKNNAIYYLSNDDEHHFSEYKVIFNNNKPIEEKVTTCSAEHLNFSISGSYNFEYDKIKSKNVVIDEENTKINLGFYLADNKTINIDAFIGDYSYEPELFYLTKTNPYLSDESFTKADIDNIMSRYDIGVVESDKKYFYVAANPNCGSCSSTIVLFSYNDNDYFTKIDENGTINIGRSDQGIVPTETHPNYAKYVANDGRGYYIDSDAIYYLEKINSETANEYKVTIEDGKIVKTKLGVVDVVLSGAVD